MLNLKSIAKITLLILTSMIAGLVTVEVGGLSHGSYIALLGLPALIILGMLFVFNRNLLFLIIIFTRVSIDPFIVNSKMGVLGLGAVLNLIVIIMALNIYPRLSQLSKKLLMKSWFIFIAILFISTILSSDILGSFRFSINIIVEAALFIIGISLIKNEIDYGKWLRIVFLSSVVPIGYAILEKLLGNAQFYGSEGFRLQGVFFHPNVLGFYAVLMISVCLLIIKIKIKVFNRIVINTIALYILIIFTVLLFTKTRSAWIGCFVFMFLYGAFFEKKYLVYMSIFIALALCVPEVQDRLSNVSEGEAVWGHGQLNSYSWRQLIWHDGLSWMQPSKYIFGYGLDSFKANSEKFFTLYSGQLMGAHNIYVELFFEVGALGLFSYIFISFTLIKHLLKGYNLDSLVSFITIALIVEYAVFSYSDNMFGYLSFNWIFWFILGLNFGYLDYKSKPVVNIDNENDAGLNLDVAIKIKRKN